MFVNWLQSRECRLICAFNFQRTSGKCHAPSQLAIAVHRGAGSGKSTLIKAISGWSQFYMTAAGDNVNSPMYSNVHQLVVLPP